MDSMRYWKRREAEQLKHYITAEAEYRKHIREIYDYMMDQIQKEIQGFYGKYAKAEGITLTEAKRRVSRLDIEAYERKAERYVRNKTFTKEANEEMRLYNAVMKINRLELLKADIGLELVDGFDELQKYYDEILTDRTLAEFKRQAGILGNSVQNNAEAAHAVVNASFHNAKYSDRIWMYQDMMKAELGQLLRQGLIQGKNPRQLARHLEKLFGASKFNAERLMRTELARVQIEAQKRSFQANGYDEYEFIALGDACPVCRALDGKHFKVGDMETAVNAPPMHPNCRCSTAAYMGDEGSGRQQGGKESIEKSENSDIIKSDRGIIKMGLYRKDNDALVEPMPKKQLQKIVKAFKRNGGTIQMNAVTDAYLESKSAEAVTYDAKTILLKRNPGRAAVFEELIHATQYRQGKNNGTYESRLACEIEAQEKLLRCQKAYKLTLQEVRQTENALKIYQKELERLTGGG